MKRRTKRVLPKRTPQPLEVIDRPNYQWTLDFTHDTLYSGKRFRTLNIIDEGTRECLAIEVNTIILHDAGSGWLPLSSYTLIHRNKIAYMHLPFLAGARKMTKFSEVLNIIDSVHTGDYSSCSRKS